MPGAVCLVITDLTEQKRNEEILAEEKLTTQILNQAAEIFVLVTPQGSILRASQSTNRLFGRNPIFQAFDEAFHLLYPNGTPFVHLSAMSDKFLHAVEVNFKHGDNEPFSFLLSANPLSNHKGAIGIVVVMVDITERRKMDDAQQKAHDKLEQQVEERTLELRTALSEIKTLKDRLEAENIYFRHEIKMRHHFAQILGQSDSLKYVLYRAEQVAPTNTTVLILGETGTGKELIAITVPPLRQRKEDIPLMVQAFIERYARKLGKQFTSIQKETMKALQDYPWPGNVRELESIIERAVILCSGPVLQLTDKLEISFPALSSTVRTLEETERNQVLKILSETRWRIEGKDGDAAVLGIHPSTLRARKHKLGIVRPETKESN